jgi:hypothetical protein
MPIEEVFPALAKGGFQITSPVDKRYNCIAYAAGDMAKWWWPLPANVKEVFWPADVTREETLTAFRDAFASVGFVDCDNDNVERDIEKIALFANAQNVPLHAARQQANGRWSSKLGEREDIEHALRDLEGYAYGMVVLVMSRPLAKED